MPFRPLRPVAAVAVLSLGSAAGCNAPPDAQFTPSEAVRGTSPPDLLPTSRFTEALATVGSEAEDLQAGADELAARAAALDARASALSAPVLDPADRARLDAASAAGAAPR